MEVNKKNFLLYGVVEYLPISIGFVTPIFKSDKSFFTQVSDSTYRIKSFEEFDSDFEHLITTVEEKTITVCEGDEAIYSFKFEKEFFFGTKPEISITLKNKNVIENIPNDVKELVIEFVDENYDKSNSTLQTKDELWDECLKIVRMRSKRWENIFRENIVAKEYIGSNLILAYTNKEVVDIFRRQFLPEIINALKNANSDIEIIFESTIEPFRDSKSVSLLYSSNTYDLDFGISPIFKSGFASNTLHLSDINNFAYQRALEYIENKSPFNTPLMIIGDPGTGKTFMLHRIASQIAERYPQRSVRFLSAYNNLTITRGTNSPFLNNEKLTNDDIVLIDDLSILIQSSIDFILKIIQHIKSSHAKLIIASRELPTQGNVVYGDNWDELTFTEKVYLRTPKREDQLALLKTQMTAYNLRLSNVLYDDIVNLLPNSIYATNKAAALLYLTAYVFPDSYDEMFQTWSFLWQNQPSKKIYAVEESVSKYFGIDRSYCLQFPNDPKVQNYEFVSNFFAQLLTNDENIFEQHNLKYSKRYLTTIDQFANDPMAKNIFVDIFKDLLSRLI